jgi:hypothetical protein
LEKCAREGDSPVVDNERDEEVSRVPSLGNGVGSWEASTSNRKYVKSPIEYQYREGKLKRTRDREFKEPETI